MLSSRFYMYIRLYLFPSHFHSPFISTQYPSLPLRQYRWVRVNSSIYYQPVPCPACSQIWTKASSNQPLPCRLSEIMIHILIRWICVDNNQHILIGSVSLPNIIQIVMVVCLFIDLLQYAVTWHFLIEIIRLLIEHRLKFIEHLFFAIIKIIFYLWSIPSLP